MKRTQMSDNDIAQKISDKVTKLLVIENVVYDVTNYINR